MEAKRNKFDILVSVFIFAMVFTIGCHIGNGKQEIKKETVIANVSLEKIVGSPNEGEVCFVDERYPVTVEEIKGKFIVFQCPGRVTDAGFLLDGAKYLSENQPVRIFFESGFCEGRIIALGEQRV